MKTVNSLFFFLFVSITALSAQESGTLQLSINNVKSTNGKILIALYDKADSFLSDNRYRGIIAEIKQEGTNTITIENLPYGQYAISIFHDENSNDELDSNWMGIPKEPYGFSNDAKGSFGPPSYEKAAFKFEKSQQQHAIKLR